MPVAVIGALIVVIALIAGVSGSSDGSNDAVGSSTTAERATTTTTATTEVNCPPGERPGPTDECVPIPTTTVKSLEGTRANPFMNLSGLTWGDYDPVSFGVLELVDPALITAGNRFNDQAPAGQTYVRLMITATYAGSASGTSYDFRFNLGVVGDKGKVYEPTFLSDMRGALQLLEDQPDVIQGGTMSGYLYFIVDSDETNMLLVAESASGNQFIDVTQ